MNVEKTGLRRLYQAPINLIHEISVKDRQQVNALNRDTSQSRVRFDLTEDDDTSEK
jgi:hypothetical protein